MLRNWSESSKIVTGIRFHPSLIPKQQAMHSFSCFVLQKTTIKQKPFFINNVNV